MFFGIKVFGKINKVPCVTCFYAQKYSLHLPETH